MGKGYVGTWEGGYVRKDAKGRPVYVIRRMVNGAAFKISTRCHTARAALEHLARFEANPSAYRAEGDGGARLVLDADLIAAFLAHSRDVKRNSARWRRDQARYLGWWADRLGGQDLRRVTLRDHLVPALRGMVADRQRREVIKALFGWLRTVEHRLTAAQDPTLDLRIPQGNSRTRALADKAFPREHYQGARKHLVGRYRWALDVLAATGVHAQALARFANAGRFELYHGTSPDVAGVLVFPEEKDREEHRVAVSAEALEAARLFRAEGHLHVGRLAAALHLACDAAGIPRHSPGRYRHAVGTWAVNAGADVAAVAAFLGHRSPTTTRRFYSTHATPAKVPTLL